jgi:hypothetical protein
VGEDWEAEEDPEADPEDTLLLAGLDKDEFFEFILRRNLSFIIYLNT